VTDGTDGVDRTTRLDRPTLLGGRYLLGEPVGRGGMAQVLRGTDTRLGRDVAVKILRPDLARDPIAQDRFQREAHAAAALNAPSIVSVYDSGEDDIDGQPVPWIVMELVDGRTLRDLLRAEGPLPPERAIVLVSEVCAALAVAHAAGIVHRDIKPGNVMLTPAGAVKVMDFGIARAATSDTATLDETVSILGTAAYLSPEQARGEAVDARSDLYSTGCLLYELLVGEAPFVGDTPVAVAYQHVREEPVPPSHRVPGLPPDLDAVVLTAMAKDPALRYQHSLDLRADLLRIADGLPVMAVPPDAHLTRERPVPTQPRRAPIIIAAALVLALLLVGGGIALFASTRDHGPDQVAVPPLVGMSLEQATTALTKAGLVKGTVEGVFDSAPVDQVLTALPTTGAQLDEGSAVNLRVSRGLQTAVIPPLAGRSEAEAKALLISLGFQVGDSIPKDGTNQPAGTVLSAIPAEGESRPTGTTTVQLVVASGLVEVPNVVGKTQEEAQEELATAEFGTVIQPQVDAGTPGRVLAQSPGPTAKATRRSSVTLTVSVAPPPPPPTTPPASPTTSVTPSTSVTPTGSVSPTP
jgi:serine/threonine-protein kinase